MHKVNVKDIVYDFFDLSFIEQHKILSKLNLLDDEDKNTIYYVKIIEKIITKVKEHNLFNEFLKEIYLRRNKDVT